MKKRIVNRCTAIVFAGIATFSVNCPYVSAENIVNPNYTGIYYSTTHYINATSKNCTLHIVKFTNSGSKRFMNASNPTHYYIGAYDTSTKGFNVSYSGYYKCDHEGESAEYSPNSINIFADSVDTWFDYFGNVSHRLIEYYDMTYIKTY